MVSSSISASLYPLSLRVAGRACVVVGGGTVAARKVASLLAAGAAVTVVAPELGERLAAAQAGDPAWRWIARAFEPDDCAGCLLLVVATGDREVNRRAAEAGRAAGALVNIVDDAEGSDFVVPSVVQRGPLQIAVSTAGLAPAFSASLRRRLEQQFPPEYGQAVEVVAQARADARAAGSGETERRARAQRLAALDLLALLEEGGLECVRAAVRAARETGV